LSAAAAATAVAVVLPITGLVAKMASLADLSLDVVLDDCATAVDLAVLVVGGAVMEVAVVVDSIPDCLTAEDDDDIAATVVTVEVEDTPPNPPLTVGYCRLVIRLS